jgi:hypothetical protein
MCMKIPDILSKPIDTIRSVPGLTETVMVVWAAFILVNYVIHQTIINWRSLQAVIFEPLLALFR